MNRSTETGEPEQVVAPALPGDDGERKLLKSLGEFDTILVGSFGDDRALFEAVRSSLIAGRAVVMHIDDASDDDTALRLDRLFRPRFGEDGI